MGQGLLTRVVGMGVLLSVWAATASAQVGACCLNDTGACISATQADCEGPLIGSWQGAGVSCADDMPCTTTYGACCLPDECISAPAFVCNLLANEGGEFQGEGVACHVTMYQETTLTAASWIDMTGATALNFVDDESGLGTTDEGVATVMLPASFAFDGVRYNAGSTLSVHTNGFVSFDVIDVTNRPDTLNFHLEFTADASTPNAAICPLWSDQHNATARSKTVTSGGTTTLVIEWDTAPFNPLGFGGAYQLHMLSSTDPAFDGVVRFVYRSMPGGPSPLDSMLGEDARLFVGVHSTGGLSVFRRDVPTLRTMIQSGVDGVEYKPLGTDSPCLMNVCGADFDGDGDVDLGDFGVFGAAFNSATGDMNYSENADFDADGDVDLGDFGVFGAQFGRSDCIQ